MAPFLLRLATALAFLYPAYAIHASPESWLSYIPPFVDNFKIPQAMLTSLFTALHVIIGVWILSGKKIFIPSLIATLFLAGVVALNWDQIDILFRDLALALVALYLTIASRRS
ncbi:MAG TPA: hypothetical protein VJH55_02515 [Candidatus Paceibacterota bacterium]